MRHPTPRLNLFLPWLLMGVLAACVLPPLPPPARVLVPTATPLAVATKPTPGTLTATSPSSLTVTQAALLASLPSQGVAPELHNSVWFNGEPQTLADLRGKVVMVEFWTFGCINCQHVLPAAREWYTRYHDDGFELIGVHTPEFAYEKDLDNVQVAIANLGVTWPVAIDNDWATWRAYANHYWPAAYLIDKAGHIRLVKIGEGHYEYTETVIQALLAEPAAAGTN